MKPATVLYIIYDLDVGGTEQQLLELVKRLDRTEYLPLVCVLRKLGRVSEAIADLGIEVINVRKRRRYDLSLPFKLRKLMRARQIDIVHTFLFSANSWGRLAAVLAGVPRVIASERNVDDWKGWHHHAIDRFLARFSHIVIGNAEGVRTFLVNVTRLPPRRVAVVLNGVDATRFPFAEPIPHDGMRIGCMCRFEPEKGLELFIEIAEAIASKFPEAGIEIGGFGSLEGWFREQLIRRHLDGVVRVLGKIHDQRTFLRSLDLFLLTSVREGLANVLLEAGLCNLPAIATNVGGNAEVIEHGETGLVFPAGDVASGVKAVSRLLEDTELRRRMGKAARARILELFDVDRMVRNTTRWYRPDAPLDAAHDGDSKPVKASGL